MECRCVLVLSALAALDLPIVRNQAIPDNRCYLENGAASESFFVGEEQPVGATIGQLRVHGDPRPGGNVALRIQEADSPVAIAPGTRNLTLRRRLDKEGVEGPASVFINLVCERLHTPDPGFVIPVSIRVTDANDNAPAFVNAPYVLNISEVTVVGTRVLQGVHAVDADQPGPFGSVRYAVLPGAHADYFAFENELEGTLVLRRPLDYEALRRFDVRIRAQDHGEPARSADTVLTVHVLDADDQNPTFRDERYTAQLPEPPVKGAHVPVQPRELRAADQDLGLNAPVLYTFGGAGGDYALFAIDKATGRLSLTRDVADGELLHPATLVIKATQQDNADRYALATLAVARRAAPGVRFLRRLYSVRASEALPPGAVLAVLANNRPGEHLRYFVSEQGLLQVFSINPRGELGLRRKLDYEERAEYAFKVFATDGVTNDSSVVNVTVEDVNEWEPRFRYPHYEFFASGQPNEIVGRVEAADGDRGDRVRLSLTGTNASLFAISHSGELLLKADGRRPGAVATFAVVAADSGDPPKRASVPVTVHFPTLGKQGAVTKTGGGGSSLILAGLGGTLLLLAFVIALLVAYIVRAKKRRRHGELPSLQPEKSQSSSPPMVDKVSNPMFAGMRSMNVRSPTATAMGGIPSLAGDLKSRIPSPKVHPAPQPPNWPASASSQRVKKLSWGDDKTDSDSVNTDNMNNIDVSPKAADHTNLTVYF